MTASDAPDPTELETLIAREIRSSGAIPFSRFMELALYHPALGYYVRGDRKIGPEGDFVTASDAGTAFGECVARQLEEMDAALGGEDPFVVVEFGSGRGLLARDVLDALARRRSPLRGRIRYVMVEVSPALRERAARESAEAEVLSPGELRPAGRGCALAVELFDALPVRRVRRREGTLVEIFVDLDPAGRLVEREGAPSAETVVWAERYAVAPAEGDEGEVCPALGPQLDAMASAIERGFLVIVDYGHSAPALYGPTHHAGTLLAYRRHRTSGDLLARVGEQDLTAHVNFTALEDRAREIGLALCGRTTQDRFLVANGILERFQQDDDATRRRPSEVKRRLQALQLLHPEGMGRRFHVLAFAKRVEPPPRLSGFQDPFPVR